MLKKNLDALYLRFNKREYVDPDPLQFLYDFSDIRDREVAGLIAAFLSYGRVSQILKSVSYVLDSMGDSPHEYLRLSDDDQIIHSFREFKYRFTKGDHLSTLLLGIKEVLNEYGSLQDCFAEGLSRAEGLLLPAWSFFLKQISSRGDTGYLVADPDKRSACKRNNLFLRWMVRKDDVDPGGWDQIPASRLLIPLDTHMHRTGIMLGFTQRRQADLKTAIEITQGFRKISPEDPVKYDFSLTRFGIRSEMNQEDLWAMLKECTG